MTTLNLPIERKYFHLEIGDKQFELFYNETQQQIDHSKSNPNYQRIFARNYMTMYTRDYNKLQIKDGTFYSDNLPAIGRTRPDFSFSLVFFKRVLISTQEDNYVRFILNLLNVLFLWFDLGVLDLYERLCTHLARIKSLVCCKFI